jgi:cell division protein FtsQ
MIKRPLQLVSQYKILLAVIVSVAMSGSILLGLGERDREVHFISVTGDLTISERSSVEQRLAQREVLSNIDDVKRDLESIGWVHTAHVTLHWPDEIAIRIIPQVAIAYWNDDAFINSEGVVFESIHYVGGELPQLYGPVGKEEVVMGHYQKLSSALMRSGHFIEVLMLNDRGSLEFESKGGLRVALGNVDIEQRLQRFLRVSKKIEGMDDVPEIEKFDARYINGVAIGFVEEGEGFEVAKTFKSQGEVSL